MASIILTDSVRTGTKENSRSFREYMTESCGDLGEYILREMKNQGLSFADIVQRAEKKGFKITHSYLSKIVSGAASNLSTDKIEALAAGLDRPPEEVFGAAIGRHLPKDDIRDAIIKAIAFGYPKLTTKDRDDIAVLLRAIDREIKERLEK